MIETVDNYVCTFCQSSLGYKDRSIVIMSVNGKDLLKPAYRFICNCNREVFYQVGLDFVYKVDDLIVKPNKV